MMRCNFAHSRNAVVKSLTDAWLSVCTTIKKIQLMVHSCKSNASHSHREFARNQVCAHWNCIT